IGVWSGGAYTDDKTGAFSHCVAAAGYQNGAGLFIGQNSGGTWLLGFTHTDWNFSKGEQIPVEVTFDGQSQFKLFAGVISREFINAYLPSPAIVEHLRKGHTMAAEIKGRVYQFELKSTGQLLPTIANCVQKTKSVGIAHVGDFTVALTPSAPPTTAKSAAQPAAVSTSPKSSNTTEVTGTGFAVSADGHVVTNHHVISGCTGEISGTPSSGAKMTLRVVSTDETNDLALLQASSGFKDIAVIRATPVHSGDAIVAIGYPYHGLLSSDFTVTTGIVSSL